MLMVHGMPKWSPKDFAQFRDIMGDICVSSGFPGRGSTCIDIYFRLRPDKDDGFNGMPTSAGNRKSAGIQT